MHLTTVKLSDEDVSFCKLHKLQYTSLMREAINRRREVIQGHIVDNVFEERRKRERWQQIAEELKNKYQRLEKKLIEQLKGGDNNVYNT